MGVREAGTGIEPRTKPHQCARRHSAHARQVSRADCAGEVFRLLRTILHIFQPLDRILNMGSEPYNHGRYLIAKIGLLVFLAHRYRRHRGHIVYRQIVLQRQIFAQATADDRKDGVIHRRAFNLGFDRFYFGQFKPHAIKYPLR